jgi:uncharacterized protein (DUF2141 family)
MKAPRIFIAILIAIGISSFSSFQGSDKLTLKLKITNIREAVGDMYIAVYADETTYMKDRFAEAIVPIQSEGTLDVEIKIPKGIYAVTIFQDENGDTELNTNFMGIPKESFGFSNNPKIMFGPPNFKEASFDFTEDGQQIEIALKK